MARFLVGRIVPGILVLWATTTFVFLMFFVAPSNVARTLAGRQATPETVQLVAHRLGLDRPLSAQYGSFMWKLLHGNLGYSFYSSEPVTKLLLSRLPVTFSLALGAAVLWLVIGVAAGVFAARRPRSVADRVVGFAVVVFYSTPTFLLGVVFLYFLFYKLRLAGIAAFPGSGYVPFSRDPLRWADHLVLPWLTVALVSAAFYARLTRALLLDVLGEDFVRTARAKGLRERRVVYRHALRVALPGVITQFGVDFGTLLGGVIIVENVFGLPGLGALALQSVTTGDQPVIIGTVILAAAAIVSVNIVVDSIYAVLDPRVRVSS
jgi:peptide/nickel transport system permease protein